MFRKSMLAGAVALLSAAAPAHAQEAGATPELCTVVLANSLTLMKGEEEKKLILMFQSYYAARARGSSSDAQATLATLKRGADQVAPLSNEALGAMTGKCMAGLAKEDVQTLFLLNASMAQDSK